MMQTYQISTRCSRCDILLDGREQFVGHMIHSHDMLFEQASAVWKSMCDSVRVAGKAHKSPQSGTSISDRQG